METQVQKCARCVENGLESGEDCEFYGEPNGCNAPEMGHYPKPRNAVEMSGALEAIAESARSGSISSLPSASLVLRTCEDALKKQPRNCDVGTPDEQSERFDAHCRKHMGCLSCPLREEDGSVPKHCEFRWAQMPYEEGGVE